jgi:hypothetical protein
MATLPDRHERSVTSGRAAVLVVLAGLGGLATAAVLAPEYLYARGLPLDDAWIHAVYGRSLARTGALAYNPGIPATGATSPLWALGLALPHLVVPALPALLLTVKLLGFALHLLTVVLLVRVFADGGRVGPAGLVGCLFVAFHPDLVSASMSGMEVPLATAAASALLLAAVRGGVVSYGVLSLVAPLARPELSVLSLALPVGLFVRRDHRRLAILAGAAGLGNAVAYALLAARSLAASGLPLPATFYAKVGTRYVGAVDAEILGFDELLGRLPVVDSSILLTAAMAVALSVVVRRSESPPPLRHAAAALLAGLLFCAVSFLLVPPVDPRAFYHQRYVLPALPLLVAAIPLLLSSAVEHLAPRPARRPVQAAVLALLVLSLVVVARFRFPALSSDAHNIDDVQVAIGRSLAAARPDDVVWAVDAGAVRYFGNAFVVDLLGLNNAALLGPGAQRFLDGHAPRFIEAVPTWSSLDAASARQLSATHFRPSTYYSATTFPSMREHWLVRCDDPGVSGQLVVRERTFSFRCAAAPEPAGR